MALLGFLGALAAVTVAAIWATMRLTMAGGPEYLQSLIGFYRPFLGLAALWLLLDYGVLQAVGGSIVDGLSYAAQLLA